MYNHKEYGEILKTEEYNFIRENKYLGDNILLLALGGSRAYGTNLPESDVDIRGFAVNPSNQIYGLQKDFEQVVDVATDTTIYSLNKMVQLLTSCNPNTIEILGCRPEDYLYIHELGQKVLDNKVNFLSKKAIDTFGGYANAQYNRLEHALLGNGQNDDKKLEMLLHSLNCALTAFNSKHQYTKSKLTLKILSEDEYLEEITNQYKEARVKASYEFGKKLATIKLDDPEKKSKVQSITDVYHNNLAKIDEEYKDNIENPNEDIGNRIVLTGEFNRYPIGELQILLKEFHQIKSDYGNINKRNHKKDAIHMAKHMTHLLRLYKMGTKLNESMTIQTYWDGEDHDLLMSVRLGEYMTGDGMKVRAEFYELLKKIQDDYNYSVKHTVLPDKPNIEALNQMLFEIYSKTYSIG